MKNQLVEEKIQALRDEIADRQAAIRKLHLTREPEPVHNYSLLSKDGSEIKIKDCFKDKQTLLVIHNMGKSCVYCTMWADTLVGQSKILQDHTSLVLVSPDAPETLKAFSEQREWNYPVASAHNSSFIKDLGFQEENGDYWPGVSVLTLSESGEIHRVSRDFFGPGDPFCAPWHFFDMLPNGAKGWQPKYNY